MVSISNFFRKIFNVNPNRYYVEVVRMWNHTSYCTDTKCMTASNPVFVIKKRNLFKRDENVSAFWYTSRIEEALNRVRELNGTDYSPNEKAYTYPTYVSFDDNNNSGTYVKF